MNTKTDANEKYVQVNGLNMYYEDHGEGEPLVLIHAGILTGSFYWNSTGITSILAKHYHVYLPDSRGHGKTNNPAGELSYAMMADDMAAFIEKLDIKKPLVVGWSDGGQIAIELGMRHPGIAKGLVIGAAFHRFTDQYLEILKSLGITEEIDFEKAEKTPFFINLMDLWKNLHGEKRWRKLLKEIGKMYWTPLDYTYEDFQKISIPALVLLGDRDELVPAEIGVEMYQMLPKGELAIIPNSIHNLPRQSPKEFAQLVIDFSTRCNAEKEQDKA